MDGIGMQTIALQCQPLFYACMHGIANQNQKTYKESGKSICNKIYLCSMTNKTSFNQFIAINFKFLFQMFNQTKVYISTSETFK